MRPLYAYMALLRRDLTVYLSYRTRLVSQLLTSLFSITLFYYVSRLVHVSGFATPTSYFSFVVVGIAMVGVLYSCFTIPDLVRQELVAGTFDRLLLSPFGATSSILAMALFPLLYSFVLATATLLIACAVFGLHLHLATVPLAIPVMALTLVALLPLGMLFAALTIVVKQGSVGTSWVIALFSIVGGLYFPVSVLPSWLRGLAQLQPFTPATGLLRHLLVDASGAPAPAHSLLKLFLFAVALVPLSTFALSRAIRFGQARGTIIEY
ncbi:MAG TPA: ABC transporter permease [Solirubrobacteraceae bacterium]